MTSGSDRPVLVDLNADLGELEGVEGETVDDALLAVVSSANVACGGHAGDLASMLRVCTRAASAGVAVGAHLSYPDREGFGRAKVDVGREELARSLTDQLVALDEAAQGAGTAVTYVKPHGALYHACADDPRHVAALLDAVLAFRRARGLTLPVLHQGAALLDRLAHVVEVPVVREGFADRAYGADGRLVPRGTPGAVLQDPDEAAARALGMVRDGAVIAIDGTRVPVAVSSLCVHSDSPDAAELARRVRATLGSAGVVVVAFAPPPPPPSGRMAP